MRSTDSLRASGFWSYSRGLEEVGLDTLHRQMRACLSDQLSPLSLELWRDNDSENGVGSGRSWPAAIAGALGRSIMFFWIQSPRWLERDICRLEFDAFRDRVSRIARAFPASPDPDELWSLLVTPVHVLSIRPDAWQFFSPEIRERYQSVWLQTQRHRMLDLSALTRIHDPLKIDTRSLCMAAAQSIYDDLLAAAALLGTTLPTLLDYAARPDPAFEAHWRGAFERPSGRGPTDGTAPDPDRMVSRQKWLAERIHGGRTQRHISQLGLDMLLLPGVTDEAGFWCSAESVEGSVAAVTEALAPHWRPARGAAGYLLWPEEAVRAVLPELKRFHLDLPDDTQAAVLSQAFGLGRETTSQLGFPLRPGSFWQRAEESDAIRAVIVSKTAGATHRHALFLVSRAS